MVAATRNFFDPSMTLRTVSAAAALFGSPDQIVLVIELAWAFALVPLLAALEANFVAAFADGLVL